MVVENSFYHSSRSECLSIAVLPFVPESPRWLLSKGRVEGAREILAIIHGNNDVNDPNTILFLEDISRSLEFEKENHSNHPWKELVSSKANFRRLVIIVSLGTMGQMLGNFVIS